jgi:small subunit ribosomal protein S5
MRRQQRINADSLELKDAVISINRVTKVVKGGKNMSFSALVVVGNGNGIVGFGSGKAAEVPVAIRKGLEAAKKNLIQVPLSGHTIAHPIVGIHGAGQVLLKPAPEGKGVIAGAAVRTIMQVLGVRDVVTKVLGSNNPHNIVRATFDGLDRMKSRDEIARLRGKRPEEI